MDVMPIDLSEIVAIVMGSLMVLIPVGGLTLRFALKPLIDSLGGMAEGRQTDRILEMSERRIALLEQQLESLEGETNRLREAVEFHSSLSASPTPTGTLPEES
jgi:hypothetical protein